MQNLTNNKLPLIAALKLKAINLIDLAVTEGTRPAARQLGINEGQRQ